MQKVKASDDEITPLKTNENTTAIKSENNVEESTIAEEESANLLEKTNIPRYRKYNARYTKNFILRKLYDNIQKKTSLKNKLLLL